MTTEALFGKLITPLLLEEDDVVWLDDVSLVLLPLLELELLSVLQLELDMLDELEPELLLALLAVLTVLQLELETVLDETVLDETDENSDAVEDAELELGDELALDEETSSISPMGRSPIGPRPNDT